MDGREEDNPASVKTDRCACPLPNFLSTAESVEVLVDLLKLQPAPYSLKRSMRDQNNFNQSNPTF